MQAHLSSGCARCRSSVEKLRAVVVAARAEAAVEPPEHAVRYAHAVYSLRKPETLLKRLVARLVHDSAREPLPAGLRAGVKLSRRALYAAGNYQVDLQLERQPASDVITLIGQLVGGPQPNKLEDIPVWLMERERLVERTSCNAFGEFQLEYEPRRNLRLLFPLKEVGTRIEIALARLSPGKKVPPRRSAIPRKPPGHS